MNSGLFADHHISELLLKSSPASAICLDLFKTFEPQFLCSGLFGLKFGYGVCLLKNDMDLRQLTVRRGFCEVF